MSIPSPDTIDSHISVSFDTQDYTCVSDATNTYRKPKILSLNCCSLRSNLKKAALLALINEYDPDIICGCESHLDKSYLSAEIFPKNYNIFRKDRTEGAGGVFLCVQKGYSVTEDPTLSVDAELVWVKIILSNMKQLYLGSFYRPPDHRAYPMLELQTSLKKLIDQCSSSPNIILLGDFNFPSIVWSDGQGQVCPSPNYGAEVNNLFLDIVSDTGLEQYVDSPTRQGKTLDLVLSTNSNIHNLEVVPGMSDHDAVVFSFSINHVPDPQH